MKFAVTLQIVSGESMPKNLEESVKAALETIPGVYEAEVEAQPEPDKGIGEQ